MRTQRWPAWSVVGIAALLLQALLGTAGAQNPAAQVPAQTPAIVSGVFVDSAGAPIPHGVLSVVGESLRVVSDSQGRFRLAVPPGPRLLAARALGYRPLMWAIALQSGVEASVRVRLGKLSITLTEITVVGTRHVPSRLAGFYERRRFGLGKYLDPEAIARRWNAGSTADFMQGMAGVRITQASGDPMGRNIGFMRCSESERDPTLQSMGCLLNPRCSGTAPAMRPPTHTSVGVYVDGFRVVGQPGEVLAMINPADVEAIEVYRGPSELPAEFMSDDCAAIVIWTKY